MQADLLDVLTRLASASNIRCMRVTPPFDGLDQFDYGLRKALDPYFDWQGPHQVAEKSRTATPCALAWERSLLLILVTIKSSLL